MRVRGGSGQPVVEPSHGDWPQPGQPVVPVVVSVGTAPRQTPHDAVNGEYTPPHCGQRQPSSMIGPLGTPRRPGPRTHVL